MQELCHWASASFQVLDLVFIEGSIHQCIPARIHSSSSVTFAADKELEKREKGQGKTCCRLGFTHGGISTGSGLSLLLASPLLLEGYPQGKRKFWVQIGIDAKVEGLGSKQDLSSVKADWRMLKLFRDWLGNPGFLILRVLVGSRCWCHSERAS